MRVLLQLSLRIVSNSLRGMRFRLLPVAVFSKLKDNIRCVVLNSCYSSPQAKAIARTIECVVGMSSSVGDDAAIAFAESFYQALGFGRSVRSAFELGCLQVALTGVPGEHIPKLHCKPGVNADSVFLLGQPEIWAEFVLDRQKPVWDDDDEGYGIRLFMKHFPEDTFSVVYQLNDESFRSENQEFEEIRNDGQKGFEHFIASYGDFEIRASIWCLKSAQGVRSRLSAALKRRYGTRPPAKIKPVLKSICIS